MKKRMGKYREVSAVLFGVVVAVYLLSNCGGGDELPFEPLNPPPNTKFFRLGVMEVAGGFPSADIIDYEPPGIPPDYFAEGNVMVEVRIGVDYWPPQKLEIDFDGTVSDLSYQDIDYAQYPYSSTGRSYIGKCLYIRWPFEPVPELSYTLPYTNISAVLIDANGTAHYLPEHEYTFGIGYLKPPAEFPEAELPNMHKPPDLPSDYFQEGNVMFMVGIGVDLWPPQKLEIDFDGSIPLKSFKEIDYTEYPYLDEDHTHVCKILYVIWPYDDLPPIAVFEYERVWGVLVDRNGVTHYFPYDLQLPSS